jgi:hypothetical protein
MVLYVRPEAKECLLLEQNMDPDTAAAVLRLEYSREGPTGFSLL